MTAAEAARKVIEGFDQRVFVRDIMRDAEPGWGLKVAPYVAALAWLDRFAASGDESGAAGMYNALCRGLIERILEADAACDPPGDVGLRLEAIIRERDALSRAASRASSEAQSASAARTESARGPRDAEGASPIKRSQTTWAWDAARALSIRNAAWAVVERFEDAREYGFNVTDWHALDALRAALSRALSPATVPSDLCSLCGHSSVHHSGPCSYQFRGETPCGCLGQDVLANWGDFLRIRHELIHAWTAEGKHPAEIAHSLSMDQMQVTMIAMTPFGPRNDDPRWSLLRRAASQASSAAPSASGARQTDATPSVATALAIARRDIHDAGCHGRDCACDICSRGFPCCNAGRIVDEVRVMIYPHLKRASDAHAG